MTIQTREPSRVRRAIARISWLDRAVSRAERVIGWGGVRDDLETWIDWLNGIPKIVRNVFITLLGGTGLSWLSETGQLVGRITSGFGEVARGMVELSDPGPLNSIAGAGIVLWNHAWWIGPTASFAVLAFSIKTYGAPHPEADDALSAPEPEPKHLEVVPVLEHSVLWLKVRSMMPSAKLEARLRPTAVVGTLESANLNSDYWNLYWMDPSTAILRDDKYEASEQLALPANERAKLVIASIASITGWGTGTGFFVRFRALDGIALRGERTVLSVRLDPSTRIRFEVSIMDSEQIVYHHGTYEISEQSDSSIIRLVEDRTSEAYEMSRTGRFVVS